LKDSTDLLLDEREATYGKYGDQATCAQNLKRAMRAHPKYELLSPVMKESLEMVQHKIARILNGDPAYVDNWVDIIGYVKLVLRDLETPDPEVFNAKRMDLGGIESDRRREESISEMLRKNGLDIKNPADGGDSVL